MQIVKNRKIYFAISIILILVGIGAMIYNYAVGNGAFNFDIQFTGGTSIEANIGAEFDNADITQIVEEVTGNTNPQVQKSGSDGYSVVIKTKSLDTETRNSLRDAIMEKYSITAESISIQDVSSTVSKEMQTSAFTAVLVACIAMLIYIAIRFRDIKTAGSAVLALVHDAAIVVGCYALLRIPMSTTFIAVILTILGYSVNASIVIFDRVRENKTKVGKNNFEELVNRSVSQTLRRSLFTSFTTFLTVLSLYIFGVESIKEFALPIAVGIVCGTYSSVFIAGNLWYTMSARKTAKQA